MFKAFGFWALVSIAAIGINAIVSVASAAKRKPKPEPISEENAQVLELLFYATPAEVQQAFEWGFTLPVLGYLIAWAFGTVISFASK